MRKIVLFASLIFLALTISLLPHGVVQAETINYNYDDEGQLIQADFGNGFTISYAYDIVGNITSIATTKLLSGDINSDRAIDLRDAVMALQILSMMPLSSPPSKRASIKGNAKIGVEEATYILQKVAEIR